MLTIRYSILVLCALLAINADRTPVHDATAAPASLSTPVLPDTAAGQQLAWLLEYANQPGNVGEAEIAEHFTTVTDGQLTGARTQARRYAERLAPVSLLALDVLNPQLLLARVETPAGEHRILLEVDEDTRRIKRLMVLKLYSSFAAIDTAIQWVAPRTQLLVAELDDAACRPLHAVNAGERLAIASTFKLYILRALVDAITDGSASWDELMAISEAWKSPFGGALADAPVGQLLTLRTLAERMITVSDNTAADHLLHRVGSERVEAVMPAGNAPVLATRELFLLWLHPDEGDAYLALAESGRRDFLGTLADRWAELRDEVWLNKAYPFERLGWFASAEELCALMGALAWSARTSPEAAPVLKLLARDSHRDPRWTYVGYKGGGLRDVYSLAWLLRRDDDRWFVLIIGVNDPRGRKIDRSAVDAFAWSAFDLMADIDR